MWDTETAKCIKELEVSKNNYSSLATRAFSSGKLSPEVQTLTVLQTISLLKK